MKMKNVTILWTIKVKTNGLSKVVRISIIMLSTSDDEMQQCGLFEFIYVRKRKQAKSIWIKGLFPIPSIKWPNMTEA